MLLAGNQDLRWEVSTGTICGKACPHQAGANTLRAREGHYPLMGSQTLCHWKIIAEYTELKVNECVSSRFAWPTTSASS